MRPLVRLRRGQRRLPKPLSDELDRYREPMEDESKIMWVLWDGEQYVLDTAYNVIRKAKGETMPIPLSIDDIRADNGFETLWDAAHQDGALLTKRAYGEAKKLMRARGFANANMIRDEVANKAISSQWIHGEGHVLDITYGFPVYQRKGDDGVTYDVKRIKVSAQPVAQVQA